MNDKELLMGRRSIRTFNDLPVTNEEIREVVSLASYAPSWKNSQTARYIVIKDKAIIEKIANEAIKDFKHNTDLISATPVLVALCTVNGLSGYEKDGSFTTTKGTHFQSLDAGIAAQTFCLAAHSLDLGTVILGIYEEDEVVRILNIPDGLSVSCLIAMGHHDVKPSAPKRKDVSELLTIIE